MSKQKSITVWITRDEEGEDDCNKLWIHGSNPKLYGKWASDSACQVIPNIKYGKKKRIRLMMED